jgi:hypothetical protein
MKQLLFSLTLLLVITKGHASSDSTLTETDSISFPAPQQDSSLVFTTLVDPSYNTGESYVACQQNLQGKDQETNFNIENSTLPGPKVWKKIVAAVKTLYDVLAGKMTFGYFEVPGQTDQGPFTLFDRTTNAPSLQEQVASIQYWIMHDAEAKAIYIDIWEKATNGSTNTGNCGGDAVCEAAATAKCAAFVYIIGLKVGASGTISYMGNPSINDPGQTERDVYYGIAMTILEGLENPYPASSFADNGPFAFVLKTLTLGIVNQIIAQSTNYAEWGEMEYRAKEQEMYLQAFDLLKWSQRIVPSLESPNPDRIDKVVKALRNKIVKPMHRRVKYGQYLANNNVTLMPAAAMGMASVVLHDDGDWLFFINGHPKEWAHAANYNIHNTMWDAWLGSPMSKAGDLYGYAEGTHYFQLSFESLLPYFKTYANFVPRNYTDRYFSGLAGPFSAKVKNFSDDGDYDNLYKWYNKILQPDGRHPIIDDGKIKCGFNAVLALTNIRGSEKTGYNWVSGYNSTSEQLGLGGLTGLNLRPDYLAALSSPDTENGYKNKSLSSSSIQLPGGSTVIRSNNRTPDAIHYAHLLAEPNEAIAHKVFGVLRTHEHEDAGAITIGAMTPGGQFELLTFDPPMKHVDDNEYVRKGYHHSSAVIERDIFLGIFPSDGPDYDTECEIDSMLLETPDGSFAKTRIRWEFHSSFMERELQVHRDPGQGGYYYVVIDDVNQQSESPRNFVVNTNGNGKDDEGTFETSTSKEKAKWRHPCEHGRDWGMHASVSSSLIFLDRLSLEFTSNNSHEHGNAASYITDLKTADSKEYGNHSTLRTVVGNKVFGEFSFTTILTPFKCAEESTTPNITLRLGNAYGSQLVSDIGDAELKRFHFNRNSKDHPTSDTIINPFENDIYAVLETDAHDGFFTQAKDSVLTDGGCITYTKFRNIYVSHSTTFKFKDTVYIESYTPTECYYKIDGKYHYSGYCKTLDTSVTVNFYLPDLRPGVYMKAVGVTSFTYDTNTFIMSAVFPAHSLNRFVFELTDPCMLSCFYPDSASNIVSTFTHQDGMRRYLGHPLKILQDTGRLNIYNGSQMNICSGNYLYNRDSLFLLKDQLTNGTDLSRCDMDKLATGLSSGVNQRSAIIVNENAALVLDSGSYTYVGANSSLYILKGGSLIIKAGAVVEIGSLIPEGHGEIIAFDGSYVCIDDGADIHFYKDISDTSDKNVFFAIVQERTLSGGAKIEVTHNGIQPTIGDKLVSHGVIVPDIAPSTCIPLCDLDIIMPPWGLGNREWGYAPFVFPKATYRIHNDTVCPGDSVVMNLRHILNENGYEISVCRIDSPSASPIYLGCLITSDSGTFVDQRTQVDGDCMDLRRAPETFKFILKDTGWYKIYVSVYNDCNEMHDTTGFIYVPANPNVIFSLPNTACPGYGTVVADGSSTVSHINSFHYSWTVSLITPDSAINMNGEPIDYGTSWDFEGEAVQNDFDFPGFKWIGGFKYAVGLTVQGWCGSVTKWDTVDFPLMVIAGVHNATIYDNPVGPHAIQLDGFVSGATSWNWTPTDFLDYPDSLNPISMTSIPIVYVLTGTSGDCTMSDTVTINHNRFDYAGEDRSVCFDEQTVLGTDYNAAVLFGFLNYKSGGQLLDAYSYFKSDYSVTYHEENLPIQKYFTQFLVERGIEGGPYSGGVASNYWFTQLWNAHPEIREAIMKDSRFPTYFDLFVTDYTEALDYFNSDLIGNNSSLKDSIDNFYVNEYWNFAYLGIFQQYYYWLNDHSYFSVYGPTDTLDIIWEKKVDTSWVEMTDWRGHYNILADTNKTTNYRMTLIYDALSLVEYDEVNVYIDTALIPGFIPAFQIDSSFFFVNSTYTSNNPASYKWYFGDGDSSDDVSPYHRFEAFDSVYYVCLEATNSCDTYMYCDSVIVDSSGLVNAGFSKNGGAANDSLGQNIVGSTKKLVQKTQNKNENYLSVNVPNPFNGMATIEYVTKDHSKNAEIRITNILGQLVKTYQLSSNKGVIVVDGSMLQDGLYFYSLVIDNTIFESKRMVVRH